MKNIVLNAVVLTLAIFVVTACGDISGNFEKKLNELQNKTNSLDSLIATEVDKVTALDSLINFENDKVKKLDSIINGASSKLDSLASGFAK